MIDFLMIATRTGKRGVIEIYPKFIIKKSKDLMIRGSDFYAIWLEERGLWSIDEQDALQLIDHELDIYTNEHKEHLDNYRVLHMWDAESGMIDNWHKYCQRQMRDNYHTLDEQLIFANTPVKKESYASKRLPYVLEPGNIDAYDELMQTLYSPEEREKIEWCIGSIVNGDSKTIQKFMVLYGPPGSGKSTVLNIIQKLFTGYYAAFDSQALGSASNAFSLEAFKANPLIAIQHEGNLSKIEDNTRLNSLVSHETMMVNEKFRSAYANQFKSFLILATNKPVKITDAKSGLIRRLIDVVPTGEKVPQKRYSELYAKTDFELGGIAWHCKEVYEANKHLYDDYIPTRMLGASKGDGEEDNTMHHCFENDNSGTVLKHSLDDINGIIATASKHGTLRDAFLDAGITSDELAHSIENMDYLFPDDHNLDTVPRIVDRDQTWVDKVMNGVHHVPFARVKVMFADLTEDEARAKGYIKGDYKKEQVFKLLKRSTTPTTVYKKQRFDRDDIVDMSTMDVVGFVKKEQRGKLNEELGMAFLIGDGRDDASDDKINELNIRPIFNDDDFYTIKVVVQPGTNANEDAKAKATIKSIIKARKEYKGSGSPTFYTTDDVLTDMLLLEDGIGHPLYADEAALARKLRVKEIVTVPRMEGRKGAKGGDLLGIVVNLADYTVGADKGGEVNMFDDFNIDYNQLIYLIETRCSGAMTTPYGAMAIEMDAANSSKA